MQDVQSVMTQFFKVLERATPQDLVDMRSIISTLIRGHKKAEAVDSADDADTASNPAGTADR